ncbi:MULTISPECIES: hypothetical protein [Lactiplantibacillus]
MRGLTKLVLDKNQQLPVLEIQ